MSRPDRPNVNLPAVQPGNVVISTPSWAQPTARTAAPENRAGCCGGACHSGSETDPAEQVGNLKLTRRLTPEEAELLRDSGPAADIPTEADEQARREGAVLLRRLVIGGVLAGIAAIAALVLLPRIGVAIPPYVILLVFGLIVFVAVTAPGAPKIVTRKSEPQDDGRPIGCCPGPRPPRFLGK